MFAVRVKRATTILHNKATQKHALERSERDFLWNFVKSYSDSHDFLLMLGQSFHK